MIEWFLCVRAYERKGCVSLTFVFHTQSLRDGEQERVGRKKESEQEVKISQVLGGKERRKM